MSPKISRRVIARTFVATLAQHPTKRHRLVQSLAAFLITTGRIGEMEQLVNDIAHELYEQHKQLAVSVVSARTLIPSLKNELTRMLKRDTQAHEVYITEQVDPNLIGGLIARTPDASLDTTIRSALKRLATLN